MQKIKFSVFILLLFNITLTFSQQIRMGPSIIETFTTQGSRKYFFINLQNESNTQLQCTISITGMELTEQGMPYPVNETVRNAKNWISIDGDSTFQLEKNGTKKIRFFIKTPLNISPGSYYSMIVCSTNKSQKVISQQNTGTLPTINIKYRFTSVVMVTVKGSNLRAHITPEPGALFAGDRRTMKSDRKWMIKVPVINDGNVHITVQGDVELYSENGQLLEKSLLNVGRGYLLPEKRRVFIATGEGPLPDGIYKANIRIGNLNTKEYATESMDFYVLQGTSYPGTPENEKINQIKNQSHGFILDKSEINIECVPGGKIFQALRLSNLTNDTLNIEHTIQHWKLDQDGNINFSKDLQKNIPLISLNINSFKLLPQKRKNLKLSVYMPEQTEGEYFLAITFSKKGTTLTNNIEKLVTQSVLLGIVSKGTLIKTMELQAFNISLILETGTEFEIVFNNTGNSRIYPEGKISIFDQNNTRIDNQIQFATNSFILPKSTRKYIVQHDRILPNGIYTAQLEILFDEAKQTIKKEIKFKKQNNKIAIVN